MAKIRKNLTDADMLKGFQEELTFENGMYAEEKVKTSKLKGSKAAPKEETMLPKEDQERLNRFLLELSVEWVKARNGEGTWKVAKEKDQVTIKIVPKVKK